MIGSEYGCKCERFRRKKEFEDRFWDAEVEGNTNNNNVINGI